MPPFDGATQFTSNSGERNHLEQDTDIFDVLIIGAGPCGLAAAARLREQAPSAMFTDEEHRRFHWLNKHGKRVALKQSKSGRVIPVAPEAMDTRPEYKMAVLDASGDTWLSRWRRLFSTFDISHLRSPMLWHIDPQDRDALLSHAHFNGREGELVEIRGCVGKEISKHQKKKRTKFSGGRYVGTLFNVQPTGRNSRTSRLTDFVELRGG